VLVTFKTSAYADITMFGDAAEALLKLMGQSGNVPGAIMAADVASALQTLKTNLSEQPEKEAAAETDQLDDDEERQNRVALSTRAIPLMELLEAAAAAYENVIWDN